MTALLLFISIFTTVAQVLYLVELRRLSRRLDDIDTVQAEQAQQLYRYSSVFNEISLKLFKG